MDKSNIARHVKDSIVLLLLSYNQIYFYDFSTTLMSARDTERSNEDMSNLNGISSMSAGYMYC